MDIIILTDILYPQVIAGLMGGTVGASFDAIGNKKIYGIKVTLVLMISSIIAAGAASEYVFNEFEFTYVLVHAFLGIVVSMLAGSGLYTLKASKAPIMDNLINTTSDTLIEAVQHRIKQIGGTTNTNTNNKIERDYEQDSKIYPDDSDSIN